MGLVTKLQPIGVDVAVSAINDQLYDHLINKSKWTNYNAYHRAYKNETTEGVIPEAFTENSKNDSDYKEVLFNDNVNSTSFFLQGDNISFDDDLATNQLSIFFQVNLKTLYDLVEHRADEEVRNDVIVALRDIPQVKSIDNIALTVPNVYTGLRTDNLNLDDMQPYHVFRVDITVEAIYDCDWIDGFVPPSVGGTGFNFVFNNPFG